MQNIEVSLLMWVFKQSKLSIINKRVNTDEGNKITMDESKNLKVNERIFLLCDQCFWTVTCLNKNHLQETVSKNNTCPRCNQDQLSSFPVMPNDSFTYSYSKKRGIELNFGIRRAWNYRYNKWSYQEIKLDPQFKNIKI